MSPPTAITKRVLKQLCRSPECELEELVFSCREFTWHDTLIELVRLNQAGVEMSKGTSEHQAICSSAPIRTLTGTLRLRV